MTTVLNLAFHGIGDAGAMVPAQERRFWLTRQEFERCLDAVAGRDDIRLSFDDGNRSDVLVALPALVRRGLQATFFLVGDRLGHPGYLAPDDLSTLAAAGMRIGFHGRTHHRWRGLAAEELAGELAAKGRLEDLISQPVAEAACPYGAYDRRVLAQLKRAGFRRVFTSDGGAAAAQAWLQPRTSLRRGEWAGQLERLLHGRPSFGERAARRLRLTLKRLR